MIINDYSKHITNFYYYITINVRCPSRNTEYLLSLDWSVKSDISKKKIITVNFSRKVFTNRNTIIKGISLRVIYFSGIGIFILHSSHKLNTKQREQLDECKSIHTFAVLQYNHTYSTNQHLRLATNCWQFFGWTFLTHSSYRCRHLISETTKTQQWWFFQSRKFWRVFKLRRLQPICFVLPLFYLLSQRRFARRKIYIVC